MIKTIISTLVAIAILICAGIYESKQVNKSFDAFYEFLEQTEIKLENKTASVQDALALENFWFEKKKKLHVWIPHNDIKEIDLWMAECVAYSNNGDFEESICKIKVLKVLAKQVPFNFILKFENIF